MTALALLPLPVPLPLDLVLLQRLPARLVLVLRRSCCLYVFFPGDPVVAASVPAATLLGVGFVCIPVNRFGAR